MSKTIRIALCRGLVGLGVLVRTHVASAGKPPSTPVVVTFISGDVLAVPQELLRQANGQDYISAGPFTATIAFGKYRPCPEHSPAGGQAVLDFLQSKNPITYDSLTISVPKNWGPLYSRLDFKATLEGVSYTITLNAFFSGTIASTPTLDTIHLWDGRFAVTSGKSLLVVAGPDRQAEVEFTITR
jgi:hypothetical protein